MISKFVLLDITYKPKKIKAISLFKRLKITIFARSAINRVEIKDKKNAVIISKTHKKRII